MNEEQYRKWASHSLSKEEKRQLQASEEYEKLRKLDHALMRFQAPPFDTEKQWSGLEVPATSHRRLRITWQMIVLRAAAMLVAAVGIYFFFLHDPETVATTAAGEKLEIKLPDGSTAVLNATSELSFSRKEWGTERTLNLQGEAYFRVIGGSTFQVNTSGGTVSVLGTEFNVKSRNQFFEVICYQGSVQVNNPSAQEILKQGDLIRVYRGIVIRDALLEVAAPAWLGDQISFISVPYIEVVRELERQYGVTVILEDIDTGKLFTGSFSLHDLELALQAIAHPYNLDYQLQNHATVVLSEKAD